MDAKREQALVGLFVLIAAGLLLVGVLALSGAFGRGGVTYRAYFKFAGGLEPGATVRYGGIKVGRVEKLRVDPQDSKRIEITLSVRPDVPVKTDSIAKISSLSALGDNYVEITTGTAQAPRAASGSLLKSAEYVGFADLTATLNDLAPEAQQLIQNLNQRATELRETLARVNDVLNAHNRANLTATLDQLRGMLEENRPKLKATITYVERASAKAGPLLDDLKKTVEGADKAIAHTDSVILENRKDLRKAVVELRQTLTTASSLVEQLDRTMLYNAENIDEILENIRMTTENLKQFTDTIKTRPYSLIRTTHYSDRKPGERPRP